MAISYKQVLNHQLPSSRFHRIIIFFHKLCIDYNRERSRIFSALLADTLTDADYATIAGTSPNQCIWF